MTSSPDDFEFVAPAAEDRGERLDDNQASSWDDDSWLGGEVGWATGAELDRDTGADVDYWMDEDPALEVETGPRSVRDDLLGWIERFELQQRALDAARLDLLGALVENVTGSGSSTTNDLQFRSLRAEVAILVGVSERTSENHLDHGWRMRYNYASTLQALSDGEISAAHARVVADAGVRIGVGDAPEIVARRAAYEEEVLQHARVETVNRLRPIARRIAEQFATETLDERHREAVRERRVMIVDHEGGMSDLIAHLPTVEAHAVHDRLTRVAREVERAEAVGGVALVPESAAGERSTVEPLAAEPITVEKSTTQTSVVEPRTAEPTAEEPRAEDDVPRSSDEIRADAFVELLLGADPELVAVSSSVEAMRARVQVIVPVAALTRGESSACAGRAAVTDVAELIGAGPIPLEAARHLAAVAPVWERAEVEEGTGTVLAVERYRPSEEMRRRLGARDQHCRFPGCRVPLSRCDLDHTVDAALGGETSTANLAHLCRGHHVLKHHSDWQVKQHRNGDLT
ncbi:HNH endonuclease signature motif containing protein [Leucobacter sp. USHLN153]|uniref:HNH endonuclease signature motif containing protein n=1 Tax=Leucobacter sp. USHLN153 TaxID=3081268 RepID=UPI00301A77C1